MTTDLAAEMAIAQHARFEKRWAKITVRERRLVAKMLADVEADLKRAEPGSWTAASSASTLVQLAQSVKGLTKDQMQLLHSALPGIAKSAQKDTARWLRALDKKFTGSAPPLNWDTLAWLKETSDPMLRSRLRVYSKSFARYGAAAVSGIEDAIAQRLVVGMPWTDAREEVMDLVREQVGGRTWMVDRIVRTETSTINSAVTLRALIDEDDDTEDPMLKKLVATFDPSTGEDSRLLHGQTRQVRELFTDVVTGRKFDAPPNRPNDREIVVGWRRSWGDDRGFDADTATEDEDTGEPATEVAEVDMDAEVKKAVETAKAKRAAGLKQEKVGVLRGQVRDLDTKKNAAADRDDWGTWEDLHADQSSLKAQLKKAEADAVDPEVARAVARGSIPGADGTGPHAAAWKRAQSITPYTIDGRYDSKRYKGPATVSRGDVDRSAKKDPRWAAFTESDPDLYGAAADRFSELGSELRWRTGYAPVLESEGSSYEAGEVSMWGNDKLIGMDFSVMPELGPRMVREMKAVNAGGVPYSALGHGRHATQRSALLKTIDHEWGHNVDFHLRSRAGLGDVEARAILDLWEEGVRQVNVATWGPGGGVTLTSPISGKVMARAAIPGGQDRRNTWAMVSGYAASDPRVEGLAECFSLALDGKWSQLPEQLHAPLRLMLEPRR